MHPRLKQETAVCFVCFFALARVSTGGYMQLTVPVLCGSPHVKLLVHLHMLAHLWVWVFPREKPWLAGCPVQTNTMFLNMHPISLFTLYFYFSPQFKCCGWNNYTDWSWNLYFNCTHDNPSSERCGVPYSCCTPVPGEVSLSLFSLLTYTTCTN